MADCRLFVAPEYVSSQKDQCLRVNARLLVTAQPPVKYCRRWVVNTEMRSEEYMNYMRLALVSEDMAIRCPSACMRWVESIGGARSRQTNDSFLSL